MHKSAIYLKIQMDRELTNIINACFDAVCCFFLLFVLFKTNRKIKKTNGNKQFFSLAISALCFNFVDAGCWLCEGLKYRWFVPVLHVFTFLYYMTEPLMFIFFIKFIKDSYADKKTYVHIYRVCVIVCVILILLAIISAYPGFFYEISSDNHYSRSSYNFINIIMILICYILCAVYLIPIRKELSRKELLSLLSFSFLPLLFNIPQFFFYGIATVNLGITISIICIYFNIYRKSIGSSQCKVEFKSEFFEAEKELPFYEKLKRVCFYYGYSEDAICSIQNDLNHSILYTSKILSLAVVVMGIIAFELSWFLPNLIPLRSFLVMIIVAFSITFIISGFVKKTSKYLFIVYFVLFVFIMGIMIYESCCIITDRNAVLFTCFLFALPILFCFKPCIMALMILSANVVFMDLSHVYKVYDMAVADSTNIFIISVLGIIIGYEISRTKIKSTYLSKNLDKEVMIKTSQMNGISHEIVKTLTSLIESKDNYTNGHSERVADYSVMIAKKLGWTEEQCNELWMEAILHDVGKIGVPDSILKKNGKLTDEEFKIIQNHTVQGEKTLENLKSFPNAKNAAKYHHEKYNGKGYPSGLKEKEIPCNARIVAIADAYDAMTSFRCYRPALEDEIVMEELEKGKGFQFDPEFTDIFISILKEHDGSIVDKTQKNRD